MCSDSRLLLLLIVTMVSCNQYRLVQKISEGQVAVGISVPEDKPEELPSKEMLVDSVAGKLPDGPVLMNAIRDSETGEMVATDVISASKVTARFRNVPERAGYVSIGFDVNVPSALSRSAWKLE